MRFELTTSSLARRRSTAELLPLFQPWAVQFRSVLEFPLLNKPSLSSEVCGAEAQNRTGDTRIFSPLLYRLSYLGAKAIVAASDMGVK